MRLLERRSFCQLIKVFTNLTLTLCRYVIEFLQTCYKDLPHSIFSVDLPQVLAGLGTKEADVTG